MTTLPIGWKWTEGLHWKGMEVKGWKKKEKKKLNGLNGLICNLKLNGLICNLKLNGLICNLTFSFAFLFRHNNSLHIIFCFFSKTKLLLFAVILTMVDIKWIICFFGVIILVCYISHCLDMALCNLKHELCFKNTFNKRVLKNFPLSWY